MVTITPNVNIKGTTTHEEIRILPVEANMTQPPSSMCREHATIRTSHRSTVVLTVHLSV